MNINGGAPGIKLHEILINPIEFIQKILYTISFQTQNYMEELFGKGVGADLHIELFRILPIILFFAYIFLTLTDEKMKNIFNTYQKVIVFLIILAITFLIFTSLYIQWTSLGDSIISGVQGRYFLPILPLVSVLIANTVKIKSKYNEKNLVKVLGIFLLIVYVYVFLIVGTDNM